MLAALTHFIRLACLGVLCTTTLQARTWTDTLGRTLEADFVSATPTEVNVRRSDGRTLSLPIAKLCAEDLAYVAQQASAPAGRRLKRKACGPAHRGRRVARRAVGCA